MSGINRSSFVATAAALAATLLLAACPPGGGDGQDTTGTGRSGNEARYPFAVASIPVLRAAADPKQRAECFTRTFSNGNSVKLRGGQDVRILAHDSTVAYEVGTLEEGEHYIAVMVDLGGTGLEDYALAPGDSTCWAVRADSVGLHSVFYGATATVMRPLTIDVHSKAHEHADADWIVERRYPSQFRQFGSATMRTAESSWVPPFLAPGVAFAATAAASDTTDQGGSGPWTTCASNGCCKPR